MPDDKTVDQTDEVKEAPIHNAFPEGSPARPPDPPPYVPSTPLEIAVEAFLTSVTPPHQERFVTLEVRKVDLRDSLKAFVEQVLADPKLKKAVKA